MACRMVAARRTARPMQHRTGSVKSPRVGSCVDLTKSINGDQRAELSGRHRGMSQQSLDNSDIRIAVQPVRRDLVRRYAVRCGENVREVRRDRFRSNLIARTPTVSATYEPSDAARCLRGTPYVRRDRHRRYPDPSLPRQTRRRHGPVRATHRTPAHCPARPHNRCTPRDFARDSPGTTRPRTAMRTAGYHPIRGRQAAKPPAPGPRSATTRPRGGRRAAKPRPWQPLSCAFEPPLRPGGQGASGGFGAAHGAAGLASSFSAVVARRAWLPSFARDAAQCPVRRRGRPQDP